MRITEAQLRQIIREELGSSADLIGDAMAHIEAAAAACMQLGDYVRHPEMAAHGARLAAVHRALAAASTGLEEISASDGDAPPAFSDPDRDEPL
jgi:hypothetical protein